ncbi:MAG: hypothetical protein IPI60_01095 [Saprospiraceae bacterium]|nr:hypothetical protein [Saprospiraceae bacterium]
MLNKSAKVFSGYQGLVVLIFLMSACGGTKKQSLKLNPGETYSLIAEVQYGRILGADYNVLHSVEGTFRTDFKVAADGVDGKVKDVNYSDIDITKYDNNFAQDLPDMEGLDEYVSECLDSTAPELKKLEIKSGSEYIARAYLDPLVIIDNSCLLLNYKKRSETLADSIIGYVLRQVLSDIYPPENIMKKGKWEQSFSIDPDNPEATSTIDWSYERDDKKHGRYYYGKGNYVNYVQNTDESDAEPTEENKIIKWKGVIQLSLYIDPETRWINKGMIEWRQEVPVTEPKVGFPRTSQTENLKVKFLPVGK